MFFGLPHCNNPTRFPSTSHHELETFDNVFVSNGGDAGEPRAANNTNSQERQALYSRIING